MTQSVPNGFSMDELESMLANAQSEEHVCTPECDHSKSENERTRDEIEDFALECLNKAGDYSRGPVIHKVMALMCISRFIEWHTAMGASEFKDGDEDGAIAWLRDAGKLQAVYNGLLDVSFGPDDFTFNHSED